MLALAESKDDVFKALQKDIYYKEDVWDWDKVQVYPVYLDVLSFCIQISSTNAHEFKSAFRQPL